MEKEKNYRIGRVLLLRFFCGAFFCWITVAAESAPHPRFGGTLQEAIFQPVTTLDAVNYLNFAELQVASNLYEGLVKRDRFGRISAAIAQSWTHSDDHRILGVCNRTRTDVPQRQTGNSD